MDWWRDRMIIAIFVANYAGKINGSCTVKQYLR